MAFVTQVPNFLVSSPYLAANVMTLCMGRSIPKNEMPILLYFLGGGKKSRPKTSNLLVVIWGLSCFQLISIDFQYIRFVLKCGTSQNCFFFELANDDEPVLSQNVEINIQFMVDDQFGDSTALCILGILIIKIDIPSGYLT